MIWSQRILAQIKPKTSVKEQLIIIIDEKKKLNDEAKDQLINNDVGSLKMQVGTADPQLLMNWSSVIDAGM